MAAVDDLTNLSLPQSHLIAMAADQYVALRREGDARRRAARPLQCLQEYSLPRIPQAHSAIRAGAGKDSVIRRECDGGDDIFMAG